MFNTTIAKVAAFAAAGLTLGGLGVVGSNALAAPTPIATPTFAAPAAVLDDPTAAALQYMLEEERVARDLYTALDAQYGGTTVFGRIKVSEQRHVDAVARLLVEFGLKDPGAGLAAGTYADPALQSLYDKLLADGRASLEAAYGVGIAVEKTDIADLDKAIAASGNATVDTVLGNLKRASENHLRAFEAAAAGREIGVGQGPDGAGMGQGPNGSEMGQGMNRSGMGPGAGEAGQGNGRGRNGAAGQRGDRGTNPDCPLN